MAASLPRRSVVLIFVFLAVHISASRGDHALLPTTYDSSMCPGSSMCGNVSIRYPFYLSTTTRYIADHNYNSWYSCGYTDLMISCQYERPNETPVIFLGSGKYTVLNISYDTNTILLADSDVFFGGSCPVVHHDLSFDNLWLRNTSSNDNLTFCFGYYSSGGPVEVPLDLGKYRIDCNLKGPNGDNGASFVFTPDVLEICPRAAAEEVVYEVVAEPQGPRGMPRSRRVARSRPKAPLTIVLSSRLKGTRTSTSAPVVSSSFAGMQRGGRWWSETLRLGDCWVVHSRAECSAYLFCADRSDRPVGPV